MQTMGSRSLLPSRLHASTLVALAILIEFSFVAGQRPTPQALRLKGYMCAETPMRKSHPSNGGQFTLALVLEPGNNIFLQEAASPASEKIIIHCRLIARQYGESTAAAHLGIIKF